ncbi:hypothetical protein FH972_020909 [Carpinus fangiana]|uniref:Uncharacterized protein n=1 Tax=Carpinus fangiana TaxID=176857 RepID=A0A5N6RUY3_9ROSI|nr:hypothetical protein FH972_020909 [Carpinus fangiana]
MASKIAPPHSRSQATSRTCLCAPTTHPGSFRCSVHRSPRPGRPSAGRAVRELAVIAKANSFRAFLLQMIKPSSHDLQRRRNFQPKPSRFCLINSNTDGVPVS